MNDDAGTGRWVTYDELAQARGMQRSGAVRLVQRKKWRRQAGNDGLARVLVPPDELHPASRTSGGTDRPRRGRDEGGGDGAGTIVATFTAALDALKQVSHG
jgi:hypothetical protein